MAPWLFTSAILEGRPITVYNNGAMQRDFTFIDDIVAGVLGAVDRQPERAENRIFNLGNNQPVALMDFIATIERATGRKAEINFAPMRKADVETTFANIDLATSELGFAPKTSIDEGMDRFVDWYRGYNARPD
jgi:UDP-glucuronate 4-epimerase